MAFINSLPWVNFGLTPFGVELVERRKALQSQMSTQEVFVQQFARLFQHYSESLSLEAEKENATWYSMPSEERDRLVAAARLAILELDTNSHMEDSRRYFAKPGQAEWGC